MTTTSQLPELQGLPAVPDIEKAVLGGILVDNGAIYEITSVLSPDDFSLDAHRRIFSRMVALSELGEPIDFPTLSTHLTKHRDLENVGGVAYLATLTDGVPQRKTWLSHCKSIRQKSMLRQLLHLSNKIAADAMDSAADPAIISEDVQQAILALTGDQLHIRNLEAVMHDAVAELTELRNSNSQGSLGLTTTIEKLDAGTSGIRPHELWIVGARPNVGKTPFGMQIGIANAQLGHPVLVFSLEMAEMELACRCISHAGIAHPSDVRDPRFARNWNAIANAPSFVSGWPMLIDDTPSLTIDKLCHTARFYVAKHGIKLIVVDYIQLVQARGTKTEFEQVTKVAKELRILARQTNCPILALSQLSRDAKDLTKPPCIGDLRSSGELEQAAHVIGLLHRPPVPSPDGYERLGLDGRLIMGKVRAGQGGSMDIHLDVDTLSFKDGVLGA